mmetsp:Transcript_2266/g.3084  ORF Transcript_2266/g.3084 Transcript_2266/m.3084 type:complete len:168 (-) Transcript_2266:961-1464(-)
MILGLTLLAANLRMPLETLMVYFLFFWERKSMRALLKKNLMAHKATNKLTSIIYALTLGCVIFLVVSLNLVLQSITSALTIPGTDIYVHAHNWSGIDDVRLNATEFDPILIKYASNIKNFGLMSSSSPSRTQDKAWNTFHEDATTKMYKEPVYFYSVPPSTYWDDLF